MTSDNKQDFSKSTIYDREVVIKRENANPEFLKIIDSMESNKETFESKLEFLYQYLAGTDDAHFFQELKQLHDKEIKELQAEIENIKEAKDYAIECCKRQIEKFQAENNILKDEVCKLNSELCKTK